MAATLQAVPRPRSRIFMAWIFALVFTALGLWSMMRIFVALDAAPDSWWGDYLALGFALVPLVFGFIFAWTAITKPPLAPQEHFRRVRKGPSAVFGSVFAGVLIISRLFHRVMQQNTLHGVVMVITAAAVALGLLALLNNAISKDVEEFPDPPNSAEPPAG
jgi:hypothetical protein